MTTGEKGQGVTKPVAMLGSLSVHECQQARLSRDARFDGQFYIGVKTTGIFCRPICPANLPKEENVTYFLDRTQALQAGFRPCLRCRPDSAPSSWAWKGVETTFQRAITLIEQGEVDSKGLPYLSERLGISDRYLRKLFEKYLGMSPKQYLQSTQLLFAKQLLHSSSMPIGAIAFASGFQSVRRFNDAFKQVLKLTPSQVRRQGSDAQSHSVIDLAYKGPLDWSQMLDFYRLRAIEGVEQVSDRHYSRVVTVGHHHAHICIYPHKPGVMRVEFELEDTRLLRPLVTQLRRMFDLDTDITAVEAHLTAIESSLVKYSGLRIPGVWDCWEAGVRAILGQQVSIKAAIGQLNLLASTLQPGGVTHFPTPAEVASADLAFLKMPQSRKETLSRFAQFMLEQPQAEPDEWLTLKGIGPWTVNYAKLRGASQANCFLDTDLVVKKALARFPSLTSIRVAPWGSYATFHCWSHA